MRLIRIDPAQWIIPEEIAAIVGEHIAVPDHHDVTKVILKSGQEFEVRIHPDEFFKKLSAKMGEDISLPSICYFDDVIYESPNE